MWIPITGYSWYSFFFQAEDGIRDYKVTGVQTCALPIYLSLGSTNFSQLFQDAVTYAFQRGSAVICAGNENGNGGGNLGPIYPAACSGALGVTANAPDYFSADDYYAGYGSYVDIAAPGGDLVAGADYYIIQYVWSTACRGTVFLNSFENVPM